MKINTKGGKIDIDNKSKKRTIVIITTVLIIILLMPITLAKFNSAQILKNTTQIAEPIFIVEGAEISKINAINNIGYYEFTIKNYNDTKVSEIGFLYTIEVISEENESVKFELYKGDEQIKLDNLKTDKLSISENEKTEQKYKLKVTYDKTKGTEGKDILEEVQIKVHSEQAKMG